MYEIEVRQDEKVFFVKAAGEMKEAEGKQYVEELKRKVKSVKASELCLIADGTEARTSSQEVLPIIEEAYAIFTNSGFRKVIMMLPASAVAGMQLKRVGNGVKQGNGMTFVTNLEQAYIEAAKA